jgi:hypothetical protein
MTLIKGQKYQVELPDGLHGKAVYRGYEELGLLKIHNFESDPGEEFVPPHDNHLEMGQSDRWFAIPDTLLDRVKIQTV